MGNLATMYYKEKHKKKNKLKKLEHKDKGKQDLLVTQWLGKIFILRYFDYFF